MAMREVPNFHSAFRVCERQAPTLVVSFAPRHVFARALPPHSDLDKNAGSPSRLRTPLAVPLP
jgi:hypothetical protein